jgi:GNAT superfamily N-acetyltransferase
MIETPSIREAGSRENGECEDEVVCQPYHPVFLPQLVELANRQISAIPPFWQFSPELAAEIFFADLPITSSHYEDFLPNDYHADTLCVNENGRLLAAAQLLTPTRPRLPGPAAIAPFGQINWIVARAGENPAATELLLDEIAHLARAAGCEKMGFARCGLGAGWPGVCADWQEIVAALRARGFRQTARTVILSGSSEVPDLGSIDRRGPFGVVRMPDETCGEWRIRAYAKDFLAGECEAWVIPQRFSALPASRSWITVEWLVVDPRFRQRGLGRWIFSELLHWQNELGRDKAIFWATDDNKAMINLARSLGFKEGPACLEFELEV